MSYVTVSVGVVTACHACVYNRRRQIIRRHSIFIENVLNYNSGTTFSKFILGGSVFIKEIVHRKSKEKFCGDHSAQKRSRISSESPRFTG